MADRERINHQNTACPDVAVSAKSSWTPKEQINVDGLPEAAVSARGVGKERLKQKFFPPADRTDSKAMPWQNNLATGIAAPQCFNPAMLVYIFFPLQGRGGPVIATTAASFATRMPSPAETSLRFVPASARQNMRPSPQRLEVWYSQKGHILHIFNSFLFS
ncbi:MAG TPA: hypothetical protein VG737_07495 [Cyclobacteriaceae bacterium]|nr:hypothetical protein [Cyclobacteriaceae bacterium]